MPHVATSSSSFKRPSRAVLIRSLLNGFSLTGGITITGVSRGEPDGKQGDSRGEPDGKQDDDVSQNQAPPIFQEAPPTSDTNKQSDETPLTRQTVHKNQDGENALHRMWAVFRWIVWAMAVMLIAWRSIVWKTEDDVSSTKKKHDERVEVCVVKLPALWMVLTSVLMVSMWRVGMCLAAIRGRWATFHEQQGPKLLFMRRLPPSKPPDKMNKERQRLFADIIDREKLLNTKCSVIDRLLRRKPTGDRRRLMLLALQAAAAIAHSQPDITLSETKMIRNKLRKYRRNGQMMTGKIEGEDRMRLRKVFADLPQGLLGAGDNFELILDTGCSKTGTGFKEDFVIGSLADLDKPVFMDGIAGGLQITQHGTVRYEVLDDKGELQVLQTDAYYIPLLKCRLFSPHTYFRQLYQSGEDPDEKASMSVKHGGTTFSWPNGAVMTVQYDTTTHLPRVRAYKDALSTAGALAMGGCVSDESNQNLTSAQKLLLRWHFRLGHIGFAAVQWLGRKGYLGMHGETMGAAKLEAPKCAACLYGKQGRTPTPTHHSTKDSVGSLSKEKLSPGELVFSDQYESRLPGRAFTSKGLASSSLKYMGGTLFIDAASGFIHVSHQVGLTAAETIESKMRFERDALSHGVAIQAYHTDNGVFTSKEFLRDLTEKGQGMSLSGVSAQFQNGAAENGIKIVVRNARTMMLHAGLRWPNFAERVLWPMALSHAVHLWNNTPKQDTGVAPIEVFTSTTLTPEALRNLHPWGCPVYVLAPKLKDGKKIPKWEPRSRRGQYMGVSPMHASTVGLVRNLQTGSITPQFHVVYNDFFETVHAEESEAPKEWGELLEFSRFKSVYDEEAEVPELADEWMGPKDLQDRISERARQRDSVLDGRNRAPDDEQRHATSEQSAGSGEHGDDHSFPEPDVPQHESTPTMAGPTPVRRQQRQQRATPSTPSVANIRRDPPVAVIPPVNLRGGKTNANTSRRQAI